MKIIKNYQKRQIEKLKIKLKRRFENKIEAERKNIKSVHEMEIEKVKKLYEKIIEDKEYKTSIEIGLIRQHERNSITPLIAEREQEIDRLRKIMNDRKIFYEKVKDRELKLEDVTKDAVNNFERGLRQIQEGVAKMAGAQDTINNYTQKQIKHDMKNIDMIKER